MLPDYSEFQSQSVQTYGYVFHDKNGPNHGQASIEDPVFLLERHLYGHPLAGLLWERQFEEVLLELGWECFFVHRKKQGIFLSVYVDDIKMAGKKQNMAPMWKTSMKLVDLDEPTSFLDHVYLSCTQRECKPNDLIIKRAQRSVRITNFCWSNCKSHQGGKSLTQRRLRGPTTWKDVLKNALRDIATWRTRKTEQSYKVSSPCLDDHQFEKEELASVGEFVKSMLTNCLEMFVLDTSWWISHQKDRSL